MTAYTTREAVASALDIQAPAYAAAVIDRAIEAGSRNVDGLCHRPNGFAPYYATETFDYPGMQTARWGRLWLDDRTLLELLNASSGGGSVLLTDVFARPDGDPPYDYIEMSRAGSSSLNSAAGEQRAVALTGRWGHTDSWVPMGTATIMSTAAQTTFTVSTGGVGVGNLLRIDSEYLTVTGKGWVASGQGIGAALSADSGDVLVTLGSTAGFTAGETVYVGAERMQVVDVVDAATLVMRRAVEGSVLAAHAQFASISWPRVLTVSRGANGSTATAHVAAAPVSMWDCPALVSSLAQAYAEDELLQATSGYARTIGSGENQTSYTGRGIAVLEKRVYLRYGRKARTRAV